MAELDNEVFNEITIQRALVLNCTKEDLEDPIPEI